MKKDSVMVDRVFVVMRLYVHPVVGPILSRLNPSPACHQFGTL